MSTPPVTDLIPHRPPFLFVDEIVSWTDEGLTARRTWRAEEDFYRGHYPGAPITPGVLLCEAVFQAAGCHLALKARAAGAAPGAGVPLIAKISDVRFRQPVYPGDTILLEVKEKDALGGFTMLGASRVIAPTGEIVAEAVRANLDASIRQVDPEPFPSRLERALARGGGSEGRGFHRGCSRLPRRAARRERGSTSKARRR